MQVRKHNKPILVRGRSQTVIKKHKKPISVDDEAEQLDDVSVDEDIGKEDDDQQEKVTATKKSSKPSVPKRKKRPVSEDDNIEIVVPSKKRLNMTSTTCTTARVKKEETLSDDDEVEIVTPSKKRSTTTSTPRTSTHVKKDDTVSDGDDVEIVTPSKKRSTTTSTPRTSTRVKKDDTVSDDDNVKIATPSKKRSGTTSTARTSTQAKKGKTVTMDISDSNVSNNDDESIKSDSDVFQSTKVTSTSKTPKKGKSKRVNGSKSGEDDAAILMADIITSEDPPDEDESNIGTRDHLLKDTYDDLINIRIARIHSWSDKSGNGQPEYSTYYTTTTKLNKALMHSAIVFDRWDRFANLSRIAPACISTGLNGHSFFHPVGNDGYPIVFTSVIVIDNCHLMKLKVVGNSKPTKVIGGKVFSGEWERLVGCIGMILNLRDFHAQLYKDVLSFATSFQSDAASSTSSPKKRPNSSPGKPSPFTYRTTTTYIKVVLAYDDVVPIYNGRNFHHDFPKLLKLIKTASPSLPLLNTELSNDSCAIVGYTINQFRKGSEETMNVSFNVQWVVAL